ncbi:Protein of unknown function DUF3684 [Kalmanozyma brasiliensis GHG001]|uniref:Sacsin/Nov domain-containing protein n=1 Tax=Kalmanozyma brasiliensis (strain GHG001) TaxID=1365824 RepID=V5EDK4_KALBG|nr:Protein of unknown function DUF3684 [Kalmanozyma brasiliensis GHG001]EST08526.1 Protein of unknown function DUF3684 [Kalmanozyma brasiliensis GHG001]
MAASAASELARKALLNDARQEEAITVNQRALIDKILARYAAEFTVFRELLQNADDAGATHCELRFESQRAKAAASTEAGASTSTLLPDFKATLSNWVFRNDGKPFGKDDWSRLRRIAEGNPDPDRIGAFGVGFYSLFSICEEPIVSSGDELMGFFWKGDALFTKRANNADRQNSPSGNPWTTFFMALREPSPFPDSPMALAKFLATSLTFTTKIRSVGLYWDDHLLCKLDKKLALPKSMSMPGHLNAYSPNRIMKVRDLESTAVQIDVQALQLVIDAAEKEKPRSKQSLASALGKTAGGGLTSMLQSAFGFGSSSAKEKERERERELQRRREADAAKEQEKRRLDATAAALTSVSASIHLRIATANVSVSSDKAFEREIERSTKKPPPKVTAFHLIFTGKEEYDASFPDENDEADASISITSSAVALDKGVRQIFSGLMPRLEDQGHAFIGFRTHQTTGFSGHIAARFIPTVERESLDFVDKYCAQWNSELLSMGGYVARAVYENELTDIGRLWTNTFSDKRPAKPDDPLATALKDRALHLMRFFTFRASSPSSRVSSLFLTSFFGAARQNTISLMSTRGVKHSAAVRIPNALLSDFIKDLAVIPPDHVDEAADFVREVRSRNLVQDITMDDVFSELSSRALTPLEMVACLKWWVSVAAHPSYDISLRSKLLNNAMLTIADPKDAAVPEKIQPLSSVRFYLNTSRLPTDVPLPDTCLSYEVSKSFTTNELSRVFGWSELTVSAWLKNLVQISVQAQRSGSTAMAETNLQTTPAFAEKVLLTLSRAWFALPSSQHDEIQQILADVTCIPTRLQMQKPNDAYFSNVSLFSDLPIVELPTAQVKGNLEKMLIALGVRRHVELQMIFNRLVAGGGWSHVDLVAYLASNKDTLSDLERERLKKTAIFPKHGEVGSLKEDGKPRIVRYRASELYEPTEALKALQLPVLDWADKPWKPNSDEARFVFDLGLRRYPPMETVLELASTSSNEVLRSKAMAFFFDKFHAHYANQYTLYRAEKYAFVPARLPNENKLVLRKPTEVFTNAEAAVMGFAVAGPEVNLADLPKLGLRSNPTSAQLIYKLVNAPTKDEALARKIFEYLATVPEFSLNDFAQLRGAEFIPVRRNKPSAAVDAAAAKESSSSSATGEVVLVAPMNCYFGGSASDTQFKDVFFYCDFGSVAGAFLKNCGVRNEPSIEEVAERLVSEPQRFYQLAGSADAYLGILRQIATNWSRIRTPLRNQMARSAFLLGSKRVNESKAKASGQRTGHLLDDDDDEQDEEADDTGTLVYALKKPSDVIIVDDANSHMLFASSLFYAPHEDLLQEGLYGKLGSPRLSALVEERYSIEGRVLKDTQRAREIKALVLERTPLFLFEKRQSSRSEIRKDAEWLKGALEVEEIDGAGLRLVRTLRYDRVHEQNVQKCTATASMRGSKLILHLSSSMEVDFFEVATSLSKYLLTKQRLQEVLLYMTLLSTSLRNLKRRGFHVDKILSQRKAEREAAEAKMREDRLKAEERAAEEKATDAKLADWRKQVLSVFPDADPSYVDQALRSHSDAHVERTTNDMLSSNYPRRSKELPSTSNQLTNDFGAPSDLRAGGGNMNAGTGFFSGFKNKFMQAGGKPRSSLADGTSSIERPGAGSGWPAGPEGIAAAGRSDEDRSLGALSPSSSSTGMTRAATAPTSEVTPLSSIQNNVLKAIRASRPDASSTIKSEARQTQIKEAANSYCDQGVETDLKLAGEVAGMKVYLHTSLDAASMLQANAAALERLINRVYKPVGSIFGLDPRSMYVFCDTAGPAIAFNRGGAIYLNFRYYLAWHDEMVKQGKLADPLVSTYFSVAHEIAHNVVAAHNAEHEWYFSAIAEKYIVSLVEYIARAEGGAGSRA